MSRRSSGRHIRPSFVVFLLGVVLINGRFIYLPMPTLGPIDERIVG